MDLSPVEDTQSYFWIVLGPRATAELVGRAVTVVGELDATEAAGLGSYLRSLPERPEVIDCTGVTFVGAAGISALLAAADGVSSSTVIASPVLRRVAEICGVTKVLGITG